MINVDFTKEDIMRLKVMMMDHDVDDAFAFVRDRLMPEIQEHERKSMRNHLDGGKGSMF